MNGGWDFDGRHAASFAAGRLRRSAGLPGCRYRRAVCRLAHVAQGGWMEPMNELELLIGQMVTDISAQVQGLDPLRLGLFMNWLGAHSARLKAVPQQQEDMEKNFKPALRSWLASLSVQGMLWEYRLVMDEIAWWRELDASRLNMILKSESGRRDG
jgi:hypothetical protein